MINRKAFCFTFFGGREEGEGDFFFYMDIGGWRDGVWLSACGQALPGLGRVPPPRFAFGIAAGLPPLARGGAAPVPRVGDFR